MRKIERAKESGFSLVELLIAMTVMLMCLGIVSVLIAQAFSVRARESQRTDALTASQAALNVVSREVANSGFGIYTGTSSSHVASNGLIFADSTTQRIHLRSNIQNVGPPGGTTVLSTNRPGEDITYFY